MGLCGSKLLIVVCRGGYRVADYAAESAGPLVNLEDHANVGMVQGGSMAKRPPNDLLWTTAVWTAMTGAIDGIR